MLKKVIVVLLASMSMVACTSEKMMKDQIAKIIKENPRIIMDAIEENPADFVESFQKAIEKAKGELAKRAEEKEKEKFNAAFDNPYKPVIDKNQSIRGTKGAPLVLVEYSDFRCYYCSVGYKTVMTLLEKYKGKIQFVFKHMPFQGPIAVKAAQYYEAIMLQSEDKAFKFHDEVFENQKGLQKGEGFLKSIAKGLKVDMKKLAKDIGSEKVMAKIQADKSEGERFEFRGTPGFLLNGVPVRGARDVSYFEDIISELKKRGKINI